MRRTAILLAAATLAASCGSGRQTQAVSTEAASAETTTPSTAPTVPSAVPTTVPTEPSPTTTSPEAVDPPLRVALVGDSLLKMAGPAVRETLADHEVKLDGRNGHLINEQLAQAESLAATDPDVLVVVLGANDAGPDFTREAMEQDVADLLDAVSDVRCVRWVTVQEDFNVPDFPGSLGTLTLNVTLYREAAERSNLEVVDFAPIINDQPDWHVMDLLHLDERGSRAMAELIRDSLDCPRTASLPVARR